jgi:hypoxanthine-DNA glycosylase
MAASRPDRSASGRRAVSGAPAIQPPGRRAGFAPVVDARVETLILGSFPGGASLARGQYYAHPRNQFWPILGMVLDEPLADLPYSCRLDRLLAHAIGLWDVLAACQRKGSLDADIRAAQANDFATLLRGLPALRRVLFNGRTAGRFAASFAARGLQVTVLPSTSPAHAALRLGDKVIAWRAALVRSSGSAR